MPDPHDSYTLATLAERLQASRLRAGMTLEQAAARSGLSLRTILGIEDCTSQAGSSDVRQLAITYGVSLDYLAGLNTKVMVIDRV